MLRRLVELLLPYVSDLRSVDKAKIRKFAEAQNIFLRDEHLQFLTRFGSQENGRPRIFEWWEGDFDFDLFSKVYLEKYSDMKVPAGNTFFGCDFVGHSLCIDNSSGGIFLYDEGERFALVHEGIDGFLLRCMASVYGEEAFAGNTVNIGVEKEFFKGFRSKNHHEKIAGATSYDFEYVNLDRPAIVSEYYMVEGRLTSLCYPTRTMITLTGGILGEI
ncbi:MAG TPA: hypothetical protein VGD52_04405 [Pseudoduganella sp.]